jgi:hypothetical protein
MTNDDWSERIRADAYGSDYPDHPEWPPPESPLKKDQDGRSEVAVDDRTSEKVEPPAEATASGSVTEEMKIKQ